MASLEAVSSPPARRGSCGVWSAWALPTCAGRGLQGGRAMDGENGKGYVWFENCHVFSKDMRLLVAWDGRIVPLPVAILHPDCRLAASGDVGRLGVPRRWAEQRELIPRATTSFLPGRARTTRPFPPRVTAHS